MPQVSFVVSKFVMHTSPQKKPKEKKNTMLTARKQQQSNSNKVGLNPIIAIIALNRNGQNTLKDRDHHTI